MTFAVNYVGAPFNTPLKQNRYFALSINWSVLAYILLVLDIPRGRKNAGCSQWFLLLHVSLPFERVVALRLSIFVLRNPAVVIGLRTWFSLVAIPGEMQRQLIGLAASAYLVCSFIERASRALFPAPLAPEKGGLKSSLVVRAQLDDATAKKEQ